jgi:hypothetical protein
MNTKWPGILICDEFKHIRNGKILLEKYNLNNLLHIQGEDQILRALFTGGNVNNSYIPNFYYLGLDNRPAISITDTYSTITGEPLVSTGYSRQSISSVSGFTIETSGTIVKAKTNLIGFTSTTSSWGPVKNLFLTSVPNNSSTPGILYSSIQIGSDVILSIGDTISMKFSMALRNC